VRRAPPARAAPKKVAPKKVAPKKVSVVDKTAIRIKELTQQFEEKNRSKQAKVKKLMEWLYQYKFIEGVNVFNVFKMNNGTIVLLLGDPHTYPAGGRGQRQRESIQQNHLLLEGAEKFTSNPRLRMPQDVEVFLKKAKKLLPAIMSKQPYYLPVEELVRYLIQDIQGVDFFIETAKLGGAGTWGSGGSHDTLLMNTFTFFQTRGNWNILQTDYDCRTHWIDLRGSNEFKNLVTIMELLPGGGDSIHGGAARNEPEYGLGEQYFKGRGLPDDVRNLLWEFNGLLKKEDNPKQLLLSEKGPPTRTHPEGTPSGLPMQIENIMMLPDLFIERKGVIKYVCRTREAMRGLTFAFERPDDAIFDSQAGGAVHRPPDDPMKGGIINKIVFYMFIYGVDSTILQEAFSQSDISDSNRFSKHKKEQLVKFYIMHADDESGAIIDIKEFFKLLFIEQGMRDEGGIFDRIITFLLPDCTTKSCGPEGNYTTRFSKQLKKLRRSIQIKVVEYILWMTFLTERVRIFQYTMLIDIYSLMRMLYYMGYGLHGGRRDEIIKDIVVLEQQVVKEGGPTHRVISVDPGSGAVTLSALRETDTFQLLKMLQNMLDLSTGHNIVVCYGGEGEGCPSTRGCIGDGFYRQACQPNQGGLGVCYSPDKDTTAFRGHASGPSFFLDLMLSEEVEGISINNYLDKASKRFTDTVPLEHLTTA